LTLSLKIWTPILFRNLYIDSKFTDLNSYIVNNGTLTGCPERREFCMSHPCQNKGQVKQFYYWKVCPKMLQKSVNWIVCPKMFQKSVNWKVCPKMLQKSVNCSLLKNKHIFVCESTPTILTYFDTFKVFYHWNIAFVETEKSIENVYNCLQGKAPFVRSNWKLRNRQNLS